jgi:release factor glutamine methyltransferase
MAALAHEPKQALTSGADGLDDIRKIVSQAPLLLSSCGWLMLEHGYNQAAAVRDLLSQRGFVQVQSKQDLSGIARCSGGQWLT